MKRITTTVVLVFTLLPAAYIFSQQTGDKPADCQRWPNGKPQECSRYDSGGNLIQKAFFREDGSLELDEKYDAFGRTIEQSNFCNNNRLCRNPVDNWAARRLFYQDGVLRDERYYDENGHIEERIIYNESGDIEEKQYVGDKRLDASEEFNPELILGEEKIQYYDPGGRLKSELDAISE